MPFYCGLQDKGRTYAHALHLKCRKRQIGRWVPLDHLTTQLKILILDWAKLCPLHQHAKTEEEGADLPNMWPSRVAATTCLAVSHPCLWLKAVPLLQTYNMMMCTVQLLCQADSWAH